MSPFVHAVSDKKHTPKVQIDKLPWPKTTKNLVLGLMFTMPQFQLYLHVLQALTTRGQISRNKSWEARSAYVAASSVVTFCIHTEISTQLTFIDIWMKKHIYYVKHFWMYSLNHILLTALSNYRLHHHSS